MFRLYHLQKKPCYVFSMHHLRKMVRFFATLSILIPLVSTGQSGLFQKDTLYSRQDSLRGSITPEREWWNLLHYDLSVEVDIEKRQISGFNIISYEVLSKSQELQIDLQPPMRILYAKQKGTELRIRSEGNAHFIQLKQKQKVGKKQKLVIAFEGMPKEAVMAPWDGGFSWKTDSNGKPFVATSNQGIGASVWWPCKDHGYDEPDEGQRLRISVPKELVAVGNGRLTKQKESDSICSYTWEVTNPINNYGVNINIGDYVHFSEVYEGENGPLDMDYWVLRENEEKAKVQFKEAKRTIEAFEYWFGPYPFYEDSYKLVEVPYLGMEHQSSVTYGNNYKNGYNGRGRGSFDWSGTGWGLKWDYIIVHETGHEWFANNITAKDVADLWIHESFTTYSEALFTEYHFGKDAGEAYVIGTRKVVANEEPIIGEYGVHKEGSSDMYFKGNNILHTLRHVINDDSKWRSILRGLNASYFHQTVSSTEVEQYIANAAGLDLSSFFDQYLRQANIPVFEYRLAEGFIHYRWQSVVPDFTMPIRAIVDGTDCTIAPTTEWEKMKGSTITVDKNFYIEAVKVND